MGRGSLVFFIPSSDPPPPPFFHPFLFLSPRPPLLPLFLSSHSMTSVKRTSFPESFLSTRTRMRVSRRPVMLTVSTERARDRDAHGGQPVSAKGRRSGTREEAREGTARHGIRQCNEGGRQLFSGHKRCSKIPGWTFYRMSSSLLPARDVYSLWLVLDDYNDTIKGSNEPKWGVLLEFLLPLNQNGRPVAPAEPCQVWVPTPTRLSLSL